MSATDFMPAHLIDFFAGMALEGMGNAAVPSVIQTADGAASFALRQAYAMLEVRKDYPITKRDWFAGKALPGVMKRMRPYSDDVAENARIAYELADALTAMRR